MQTLLRIEPGKMGMSKKGALQAKMEFVPGKSTENQYQTPYGQLPLTVQTRNFTVSEEEDLLQVSLQYTLESGGIALSENELEIKVASKKDCM